MNFSHLAVANFAGEEPLTKQTTLILRFIFASLFAVAVMACEEEGPAERAGEEIDETIEEAGEAVEEVGDNIREATE